MDTIKATPDTLNSIMEFDHVIRVHDDGTVSHETGTYAPDVMADTTADGSITKDDEREMLDALRRQGWSLMSGYTGQDSYNGPIMHASEFIGGRMARDILGTPRIYVAVIVGVLGGDESDLEDPEPAGWAGAYRDDDI